MISVNTTNGGLLLRSYICVHNHWGLQIRHTPENKSNTSLLDLYKRLYQSSEQQHALSLCGKITEMFYLNLSLRGEFVIK